MEKLLKLLLEQPALAEKLPAVPCALWGILQREDDESPQASYRPVELLA